MVITIHGWRGRHRPWPLTLISLLTLTFLVPASLSSNAQPPKQSPAERQLETTTRSLVAALKNGTPASVLPFLSSRGVVLDMDGERASLAEVRRQFAHQTGLYCRWFDTACLTHEIEDQSGGVFTQRTSEPRSYRDIIRLADKAEFTVAIDPDRPSQGSASVCLHGAKLSNDGAGYLLEFGFERTSAGWKLALEEGNFAGC
jgi:hypothetical protein